MAVVSRPSCYPCPAPGRGGLPPPDAGGLHSCWDRLEVFTDGSFDGVRSSWAFLVIGWTAERVHVLGWTAGCVVIDADSPLLFVGAHTHDAIKGELSAIFWALAWLAQGPKLVHPWSDCIVALGEWTFWDARSRLLGFQYESPFSGRPGF